MRLLFTVVASCALLSTSTSTPALASNDSEDPDSPPRRRLRTNLFNNSTAKPQEFPSSAPSSFVPSSSPSLHPSDAASAGAFVPTSMPMSQQTTSRPITSTHAPVLTSTTSRPTANASTPTSTPTPVPTSESKSDPTQSSSQPTESKSITANLFTAAVLDVNTTTVTALSTCEALTVQCGPLQTCANGLCCSQWGVSTFKLLSSAHSFPHSLT
jgi:hypothetical protein